MLTLETGRVESLVQEKFFEQNAEISRDGRWLAYESGDSGRVEIFVRPFNDVKQGRVQVSTAGGTQPLWSRNGQELFYLAPSGALMSVQMEAAASWRASLPEKVIERGYYRGIGRNVARTYDVSLDGKRFLMIKEVGGPNQVPAPSSLIVVQNWHEELKRLVPTK